MPVIFIKNPELQLQMTLEQLDTFIQHTGELFAGRWLDDAGEIS